MLLRYAPRESVFAREVDTDSHLWGLTELLLAEMLDLAAFDFWRNSDPKSRGRRPDRVPRPGVQAKQAKKDKIKTGSMSVTELDEWLGRKRRA